MDTVRRGLIVGAAALSAARSVPAFGQVPVDRFLLHRFGVNYVPSRNWYFCWNDWRPDDIARDFDAIAAIGADHIRIMLVWPWFQPNPGFISRAHLDRLDGLMQMAAARQLDVLPAVFTGWLSGFAFKPAYLESEPFYAAPAWRTVQDRLLAELGLRLAAHANFLGLDIGNEINCAWKTHAAEGDAWMAKTFETMHRVAPGKVHVNGVDHQPWFGGDTFTPQALVAQQDIVSLHSWSFWAGAADFGGPLDEPYTRLPSALAALARAYGKAPTKPIWMQEFGVCDTEMPARDVEVWMDRAVESAIQTGVSWFTWWCSHDVDRSLAFHAFEYDLGLMDVNNRIKPRGQTFKRLADAYRGQAVILPDRDLPEPSIAPSRESTWTWLLQWMRANP